MKRHLLRDGIGSYAIRLDLVLTSQCEATTSHQLLILSRRKFLRRRSSARFHGSAGESRQLILEDNCLRRTPLLYLCGEVEPCFPFFVSAPPVHPVGHDMTDEQLEKVGRAHRR